MRKGLTFAAAWLVAASLAVAVAWQGVGIVTSQVTDDRPASLAADEVRELAAGAATTSTSAPTPDTTTLGGPAVTSIPSGVTGTIVPSPVSTGSPPTTRTTSATTTAPSPSSPTPSTTTTPTAEAPAETRTYNAVGGSVALRFTPQGATVLWATPNAGFSVDVEPENGNGVRVEFESDTHRSRVDGWWADGPQDRVREDPR